MKKIIIAGGRDFSDYTLLKRKCDELILSAHEVEIVSGAARGADILGERYANENGIAIKRFPANWNLHGKAAGHIRNQEMAEYADCLIAFWDGKSKGTSSMIKYAKDKNLDVHIITY